MKINTKPAIIPAEVIDENNTLFIESVRHLGTSLHNEENMSAYGLSLANNTIVFRAEDSRTHILSMTSSRSLNVEFTAIKNLQPSQFMIFRNDDDLSETFGDEYLKYHGVDWKKAMSVWKEKLRKELHFKGSNWVISQLRVYGSTRVNYQNLNNWIHSAISPKNDDDFLAILRLTGMEDQLDNLRNLASKVRGARQSAAHELRQLLGEHLNKFDINQLVKTGIQSIDMFGSGHSQYTAIRIEEITNKTIPVAVSRLKRQIPLF